MAGQAAHSRALRKGQLPKRKGVERLPRTDWRLLNCVVDMLEEKKLEFIGETAQTSGKEFIERMSAILFQILVPARIERMTMRNVHRPQLILDFFDCTPWLTQQTRAAWPRQAATAQSESSRQVERQTLYSPSSPMASSEQMEGGPWGRKRALKKPALGRVLKFMYMRDWDTGAVYMTNKDKSRMSVLVFHLCSATIQMTRQTHAYIPYVYCD